MKLAAGVQSSLVFSVIGKPAATVITTQHKASEVNKRSTHQLLGGPKKRGHSTFSQISRKLLKISK